MLMIVRIFLFLIDGKKAYMLFITPFTLISTIFLHFLGSCWSGSPDNIIPALFMMQSTSPRYYSVFFIAENT